MTDNFIEISTDFSSANLHHGLDQAFDIHKIQVAEKYDQKNIKEHRSEKLKLLKHVKNLLQGSEIEQEDEICDEKDQ